jgi:hypothetical protein
MLFLKTDRRDTGNITKNFESEPYFTECFIEAILSYIPCIYLFCMSPFRLSRIYNRNGIAGLNLSVLTWIKMVGLNYPLHKSKMN